MKIVGMLGAVAALGTISSAQAAPAPNPSDVLQANSYAELLQPIPNAAAALQALDERQGPGSDEAEVQLAQVYIGTPHHHHHHHHHYRRPGIVIVPPWRRHYHHHHHHHHHHYRGYYRY